MVLEDHVGVSSDKNDQVKLLRFVGKTDDIFGRDDFEQEKQHGNQVENVAKQLEVVHGW